MDDMAFKWITALGFPIVMAMTLTYGLYKLVLRLLVAHEKNLSLNTELMKAQTGVLGGQTELMKTQALVLDGIRRDLGTVCKAQCPDLQPLRLRKKAP